VVVVRVETDRQHAAPPWHPVDRELLAIQPTGPVDRAEAMREALIPYLTGAMDALVAAGCEPRQAVALTREVIDRIETEAGLAPANPETEDTP
jgi:hypothetical protein